MIFNPALADFLAKEGIPYAGGLPAPAPAPAPVKAVKKTKKNPSKKKNKRGFSKKNQKKVKSSRKSNKQPVSKKTTNPAVEPIVTETPSIDDAQNIEVSDPNNFQIQPIPNINNVYEIKVKEDCWKYFANINNQYEYILVEGVDNNQSPVFYLINLTTSNVPYLVKNKCERYAVYRKSGSPNEQVENKFLEFTKQNKILYDTLNKEKCTPEIKWPKRKELLQKLKSRMYV